MLRWLDKYPCPVEVKGGYVPLKATEFWLCSNVNPVNWYPELDEGSRDAFLARLTQVVHYPHRLGHAFNPMPAANVEPPAAHFVEGPEDGVDADGVVEEDEFPELGQQW